MTTGTKRRIHERYQKMIVNGWAMVYEIRLAKLKRRSKFASKARTRETILSASSLITIGH